MELTRNLPKIFKISDIFLKMCPLWLKLIGKNLHLGIFSIK